MGPEKHKKKRKRKERKKRKEKKTFLEFKDSSVFSFVTVFAPSNEAMKSYKGPKDQNFILNHMGE